MERTAEEFVHQFPNGRWFIGDFEASDTGIHFMATDGRILTVDEAQQGGSSYVKTWSRKSDAKRAAQKWLETMLDDGDDDDRDDDASLYGRIVALSNDIARLNLPTVLTDARYQTNAARQIDDLIEGLTNLRAHVDGASAKKRAALVRKVRRALGYTYP